jgi:hypothetical protein
MLIHVVLLYGSCAVFLALAMATATRHPPRRSPTLLWPFLIPPVVEILLLTACGRLVMQWLLPLTTLLVVMAISRSDQLVRSARIALIVVAFGCWIHARSWIGRGYAGGGVVMYRPAQMGTAWHTLLTGLRPVIVLR